MDGLDGYPAGPKSLGGTSTPGAAPDVEPRMSSAGCRALCHEPSLGYRHRAFHRCQWLLAPVAGPSPGWAAPRWPRVGVGRWQARDVQLPAPLVFPVLSLSGLHRTRPAPCRVGDPQALTESSLAGR